MRKLRTKTRGRSVAFRASSPCIYYIIAFISLDSQFTQDNPRTAPRSKRLPVSRPDSPQINNSSIPFLTETSSHSDLAHRHQSHHVHDPLAEFYDLAKAERDNDVRFQLLYSLMRLLLPSPFYTHSAQNMKAMVLTTMTILMMGKQMMSITERQDLQSKGCGPFLICFPFLYHDDECSHRLMSRVLPVTIKSAG